MSGVQGKGDHRLLLQVPWCILLVLEVRRPKQARMNNVTENHEKISSWNKFYVREKVKVLKFFRKLNLKQVQ